MAQNNNIDIIREINDRYIVIKYFDAKFIYDKETKFINATKLCQHISKVTGKEKLFKNWIALKQTQKFMEDMLNKKGAAGIPAAPLNNENLLCYKINNNEYKDREVRGTYLHLDLIPQLCNWASKEYAFKISYIINYINGIKDYDSAYSKVKNDELKAKDDELESKTDEIKKLEEEHQKQLKAKDKELETKENKIKDLKKELKETKKKNEKKTMIIKEKNEKVKELKEEIKDKTEELEELRKTKSEDDIEIKKLKRDIELLKSQLAEALKDNKTLNEKIDDFIKAGEKEREELKQCREQINKMTTTQDIILNQMSILIKKNFKVETENKEIKKELKEIPEIILIFISEENEKQLYISRIKKDTESRVIKRLRDLKYKVFNKYQTYNSVIKYNEAIKEYKELVLYQPKEII